MPNHTSDHRDCPACRELQQVQDEGWGELLFPAAALRFMNEQRAYVADRTLENYRYYGQALAECFGSLRLRDIHVGNLRYYQQQRRGRACADRINHETSFLAMILKQAGLWGGVGPLFKPLPLPRPPHKRLPTLEEEQHLLVVATTRKRWLVACCAAIITANTTAGPSEIRHLRLGDVDLKDRLLFVREGTKNEAGRVRELPLNDAALWAVEQLVERYNGLRERWGVPFDAQHRLLPHNASKGERPDFYKPMRGWRRAWQNLREAAGMPWLQKYRLRHYAITKLLENPNVSEHVVEDLAGHLSHEMKRHYSHIRRAERAKAVAAINTPLPTAFQQRMRKNP